MNKIFFICRRNQKQRWIYIYVHTNVLYICVACFRRPFGTLLPGKAFESTWNGRSRNGDLQKYKEGNMYSPYHTPMYTWKCVTFKSDYYDLILYFRSLEKF